MEDVVSQAKAEFTRAQDRIAKCLANTPDDKLNWSPSATSRTPIELVAHAALSSTGICGMLAGKPFPYSSIEDIDVHSREAEKGFSTREQALGLLEKTSGEYLTWLDTLTPEQVGGTVTLPFGEVPMAAAITFAADHIRGHAAQIDYLQTIYGDRSWHLQD
jgi:hypothetical protein